MDGRPVVHCLICYVGPTGQLLTVPRLLTVEEAAVHQAYGAILMIDPDEQALADLWDVYQADLKGGRVRKAWFEP